LRHLVVASVLTEDKKNEGTRELLVIKRNSKIGSDMTGMNKLHADSNFNVILEETLIENELESLFLFLNKYFLLIGVL